MIAELNKLKNSLISNIDQKTIQIKFQENISKQNALFNLSIIYQIENNNNNNEYIINLKLKKLPLNIIAQCIKYSLNYQNLKDPLMVLNIYNLIKTYNTLDDSFFDNDSIYISSLQQFLDLKILINTQLKKYIKQLSIYFISLFKSYTKMDYTPLDNHIKLPLLYKSIIDISDLYILSGILSLSQNFNTNQCIYIDDAYKILLTLLSKNNVSLALLTNFFKNK